MGESKNTGLKLLFDRRLRLEFRGAKITTDAGLLAVRELDEMMGLTEMAADLIVEGRTGKNIQHQIPGLLRQSVYARLAGYEDVNDQEALARDPAMRAVVGKRALERTAASMGTVSRFETEILAQDENIDALASLNSAWVEKAVSRSLAKKVILDIDSSESPVHGNNPYPSVSTDLEKPSGTFSVSINPDPCLRLEHHLYHMVLRLWKYRACVIPGPVQRVILTPSVGRCGICPGRRLPGTTRSG